ncbi:MAG: hypothetical protein IIA81_01595 [Thaumarchaeota archaeon]|nr:hypothetical protein [Nitrososphaerota archaeon]
MTLEIFQDKEITKQNEKNIFSEFSQEQLEILDQEHAEKLVNDDLKDKEYEELIDEYQTKHHVSKQDAIVMLARNSLEY